MASSPLEPRQILGFSDHSVGSADMVQFSAYVTRKNFSWAHENPIKFWNFAIVEVFASCL